MLGGVSARSAGRPTRPPARRRAGALLRLPVGVALVTWHYVWRVTALHRSEAPGDAGDLPPLLPSDLTDECSQPVADGAGPLFHRRFSVRVEGSGLTPQELLGTVAGDFNRVAPSAAFFHKTVGREGGAEPGDEYRVQMPGPWDGPVRVVRRTPASLRLATLRGHLEAGQIEFRAGYDGPGRRGLRFEVEAWGRGGDRWADLLYSRLHVAKEMQLNMWVHVCLRAAALTGGRVRGGVRIDTRSVPAALCGGAADR
jgi:hypothetical protein